MKKLQTLQMLAVGMLVALASMHAAQANTKIYINKSADPDNYVLVDGTLSATVTHTADGLELEIPGVSVSLDCTNTSEDNADPAENCTVTLGAGANLPGLLPELTTESKSGGFDLTIGNYDSDFTWTRTTTNGTASTISAGGVITVSNLVAGASATVTVTSTKSGYDTSSASITGTALSGGGGGGGGDDGGGDDGGGGGGDDGGGGGGGTGSDACGSSYGDDYTIKCYSTDYGPAGGLANNKTGVVSISPKYLQAYPLTLRTTTKSGYISMSPDQTGAPPSNGATPRVFISETPGDKTLSKDNKSCASGYQFPNINYSTTGQGCVLQAGKQYWLNMVTCTESRYCTGSKTRPANAFYSSKIQIGWD